MTFAKDVLAHGIRRKVPLGYVHKPFASQPGRVFEVIEVQHALA